MHAVENRGDEDGRRRGRVPRRVREQVVQDLDDALPVGRHPRQVLRQVEADGVAAAAPEERVPGLLDQPDHLHRLGRDRQRPGLDAPRVEQVGDEAPHVVGLLVDDPHELPHLARVEARRGAQHRGRRALDGGQRRPQLVAHQAQELGPLPLELVDEQHARVRLGELEHVLQPLRTLAQQAADRLPVRDLVERPFQPGRQGPWPVPSSRFRAGRSEHRVPREQSLLLEVLVPPGLLQEIVDLRPGAPV